MNSIRIDLAKKFAIIHVSVVQKCQAGLFSGACNESYYMKVVQSLSIISMYGKVKMSLYSIKHYAMKAYEGMAI
jgi:hypothetical protein